jgi:competence protein ComEA
MRRVGQLIRNLLGLDDASIPLVAVAGNPVHRTRWKVTVGAAMVLGAMAIIVAIVASSIGSLTAATTLPSSLAFSTESPSAEKRFVSTGDIFIHVVGAVVSPGLYSVHANGRVIDAVMAAGGLSLVADACAVNLARPITDGEQVVIPATLDGSPGDESRCPATESAASVAPAGSASGIASGLVSLATATVAQLDTLPGIGPALAQRIIDWREATGGFTAVDQLGEVSGIGDKVLANIRDKVTL